MAERPTEERLIDLILRRNAEQAEAFKNQHDRRRAYRKKHQTEISVMKCMDGRVHLPRMCDIPMGIVRPYRNIGGIFDVAWPGLQPLIAKDVSLAEENDKTNLYIGTFHFSKSDPNLGCAGHEYDTRRAKAAAATFVTGIQDMFSDHTEQVQAVMMGVETDEDILILCDEEGRSVLSSDQLIDDDQDPTETAMQIILDTAPTMLPNAAADLAELFVRNAGHVNRVRREGREAEDREHRERILGVGMGFDWLHERNLALIISDVDPDLPKWIATAASIIRDNRDGKRIPDTEAALAIMVPYWATGYVRKMAIVRARYLMALSRSVLKERHPDLVDFFTPVMGVIDQNTRQLEVLE